MASSGTFDIGRAPILYFAARGAADSSLPRVAGGSDPASSHPARRWRCSTIPPPWGLLALGLLVLLPGDALYRFVSHWHGAPGSPRQVATTGRRTGPGEALFTRVMLGLLAVGWIAFVLAEAGRFNRWSVLAGSLAITAILNGLAWRHGWRWMARWGRAAAPRGSAVGAALLAILVLAGAVYFGRPFETVVGAEDAGIYFSSGASIARTGGIIVQDRGGQGLAEFGDAAADAAANGAARHVLIPPGKAGRYLFVDWQRLAGFFLLPWQPNAVTPQFLHLFPVWLALWAAFGGGIGAMVYGGPAFGILGVAALFYLGRRLFGTAVGLLAALFLGFNGMQLWFARESLSEPLLQVLLLTAVYGYVVAVEALQGGDARAARVYLLLAGLALGSVALTHALFPFALLPLGPLIAWLWLGRRWRGVYWWFFLPVVALLGHAVFHIRWYALGYFEGIYHHVWLNAWRDRWRTLALLLMPLAVLVAAERSRRRWLPFVADPRWRQRARGPAALALALALVYLYLLRPGLLWNGFAAWQGYIGAPVPPGSAGDFVRLGWYFSPLGMLLAGAGFVLVVWRALDERVVALLVASAPFAALYLTGTYTQEGYIYTLRRFVPIVVPVIALLLGYAVARGGYDIAALIRRPLLRKPLAYAAAALGLLVLLFYGYTNLPLIRHREYAGTIAQLAALNARFQPGDILLFSGPRDETPKLATPLLYLFGREAWTISTNLPNGALLDRWLSAREAEGRRVFIFMSAGGGKLLLPGHQLIPARQIDVSLRRFEELAQQKPHNVQDNHLRYSVYVPRPLAPGESPLGGLPYRVEAGRYDEAAEVGGFWGLERDMSTGQDFRWTDGNALLRVPWPATGRPLVLRLTLSGGVRPPELGPAIVTVGIKSGPGDSDERPLGVLTLTESFATYTIEIPPDALIPTPDGTAVLRLGLAAPVGRPGTAWRPVDWPAAAGGSYDPRTLHVRFASLELTEQR